MKEKDGADGIVLSSGKLLANAKAAFAADGAAGSPVGTDGTYKIHVGNMTLILWGTTSLRQGSGKTVTLSMRPYALMLAKSESEARWRSARSLPTVPREGSPSLI